MSANAKNIRTGTTVRFAGYQFDAMQERLIHRGRAVGLGGQPLAILAMLLERPGCLVTRDSLRRRLWPHATRIDTSRRLNTAVRALRATLADSAESPRFIQTIRGTGYRFIAPVTQARPGWRRLAAGTLVFALMFSASDTDAPVATAPPGDLSDYLTAVAALDAQGNIAPAVRAGLEDFRARFPWYRPAATLIARLAVREWRETPSTSNLAAAQKASEAALDAAHPEPAMLNLLAELALYGHWDRRDAEDLLTRALRIAPDDAETHKNLAWLHLHQGNGDRAWHHVQQLLAHAPLTPAEKADTGWLLLRLRRPDAALLLCSTLHATRARINTLSCRHTAQARLGNPTAARHTALILMRDVNADPLAMAAVADASPEAGYREFLHWRSGHFAASSWFQRAQLLADAGDREAALAALARSLSQREPHLVKLASTREFDPLKSTPLYENVLAAID